MKCEVWSKMFVCMGLSFLTSAHIFLIIVFKQSLILAWEAVCASFSPSLLCAFAVVVNEAPAADFLHQHEDQWRLEKRSSWCYLQALTWTGIVPPDMRLYTADSVSVSITACVRLTELSAKTSCSITELLLTLKTVVHVLELFLV